MVFRLSLLFVILFLLLVLFWLFITSDHGSEKWFLWLALFLIVSLTQSHVVKKRFLLSVSFFLCSYALGSLVIMKWVPTLSVVLIYLRITVKMIGSEGFLLVLFVVSLFAFASESCLKHNFQKHLYLCWYFSDHIWPASLKQSLYHNRLLSTKEKTVAVNEEIFF